jgi:hypothetical protein
MKIETAAKIQNATQGCIVELNKMLLSACEELSAEEFENLKDFTAEAIGYLVNLEHGCIYKEYPSLVPY